MARVNSKASGVLGAAVVCLTVSSLIAALAQTPPAGAPRTKARDGRPAAASGSSSASSIPHSGSAWDSRSIAYLKASNTDKDDQFGNAVAISADGNTVAVSANNEDSNAKGINGNQIDHSALNSGAVYIFTRSSNAWKQQAYLKALNTHKGYQFGSSLSLSNDGATLAVGSTGEASSATGINGNQNDASMEGAGAVYIFTRSGTNWTQQAYIKASNTGEAEDGDQFGYAVTLSGDGNTLAVGAVSEDSAATGINGNQADNSADGAGAVYVFTRSGSSWAQQAYVKPWNTTARGALFGYSVGLSDDGNTMAVGAYDEDGGRGAIYIFTRNGAAWAQQARMQASNAERGDSLGCSLAISGDGNTVLAGAFDEDSPLTGIQPPEAGANDEARDASTGAAYVFVRNGTKWTQQAYVKATNTRDNDQFGWALAISRDGDTIAVGSHLEDSGAKGLNGDQHDASGEDSGAVYIYTRSGSTWAPAAYVKPSNTKPAAEFGISAGLSGDGKVLVVGAFKEDSAAKGVNGSQADRSAKNSGAAYIYY